MIVSKGTSETENFQVMVVGGDTHAGAFFGIVDKVKGLWFGQGDVGRIADALEAAAARDEVAQGMKIYQDMQAERDTALEWKRQHLIVESWWQEVGDYLQDHPDPDVRVGDRKSATALKLIKERDAPKAENTRLRSEIDRQTRLGEP